VSSGDPVIRFKLMLSLNSSLITSGPQTESYLFGQHSVIFKME
jgi:hypothetical protein